MMQRMDGTFAPGSESESAPWLQNQAWADGVVRDQSVENLLSFWIFSVVWTIASVPLVIPFVKDAINGPNKWPLLALAFPAIGFALLAHTLRRTLRILKFGDSVFHLHTLPAQPGGDLAGVIHVTRPVESTAPMQLRLMCVNRVVNRGGRRTQIVDHILWKQEQTVDDLLQSANGTRIPVLFHIPADAKPSSDSNFGDRILWQLEVSCKTAGVNYLARFEVPVFVVTSQEQIAAPPPKADEGTPDWNSNYSERGITHQPVAGGGWRIHFDPGRNKASAKATTAIGLVITAVAIGMALLPVDSLTRIVTVSIAAVMLFIGGVFDYIAIYLWFFSTDIMVRPGSLILETGTSLFRRRRTFNAEDISDLSFKKDGESSSNGSEPRISFGIQMKTRDGKMIWIASNIFQGNYAEWLAEQIKKTVGC
jgi:hypothetical protein